MLEPFSGLSHNPKASSADCAQADRQARFSAIRAVTATGDRLCMGRSPVFARRLVSRSFALERLSSGMPDRSTKLRRLRGRMPLAVLRLHHQRHEPTSRAKSISNQRTASPSTTAAASARNGCNSWIWLTGAPNTETSKEPPKADARAAQLIEPDPSTSPRQTGAQITMTRRARPAADASHQPEGGGRCCRDDCPGEQLVGSLQIKGPLQITVVSRK